MSNEILLSRDDLMKEAPRRYAIAGPLPARGGMVRLQSLTEAEASAHDAEKFKAGELIQARLLDINCRYIVRCVVDAAGNRLLSPADVPKMMATWDRADIEFLYTEARAHVTAKQNPADDTEKNSVGTPAAV